MGEHKKSGVSLMAGEIKEEIKSIGGFCTEKFKADHYTYNVDYKQLKDGDTIEVDGKEVVITKVGKPCFPDCPVGNKPCILNGNVAFGEYKK